MITSQLMVPMTLNACVNTHTEIMETGLRSVRNVPALNSLPLGAAVVALNTENMRLLLRLGLRELIAGSRLDRLLRC